MAIGEAPGHKEVLRETPFWGAAGEHLWSVTSEFDLDREDFAIINSIQCRPLDGVRNGKPSKGQMKRCKFHIDTFIGLIKPKKILLLGNYAKAQMLDGDISGIKALNATEADIMGIPTVLSVHPAMCIYQGAEGKELLRKSIAKFKEI
jgi:DNA polymerase